MESNDKKVHRGVFLLPNALTTAAMFAGFYSIISGINGQYVTAAVAVVVAGVLDGLDGRVARLTNTQSEFGVQYDSLSDLISFGLAPALLSFNWSLSTLRDVSPLAGKLGWLAAFLFAACAALRLARFNAQAQNADKTYFQGLASPAAATSDWVRKEIAHWLSTHPPESVLIVLTDGELAWDNEAGDFDAGRSTALPEEMRGVFADEPLHVDLRWARAEAQLLKLGIEL